VDVGVAWYSYVVMRMVFIYYFCWVACEESRVVSRDAMVVCGCRAGWRGPERGGFLEGLLRGISPSRGVGAGWFLEKPVRSGRIIISPL